MHSLAKTFGRAHLGNSGYKMLFIGETGSGKTSFLNFIKRIQAIGSVAKASKDFRPFHDTMLENAAANRMESKTSDAKLYKTKICGLDVGVIDSPGFGDSRGLEQDKRHAKTIVSALTAEDYINCICLIINGRTSRLSATLNYVLGQITAILPRAVLNNIVVVFTNAADILDLNFDVRVLEEFFGQPVQTDRFFCIENPYCRFEKAKRYKKTLPPEMIAESLTYAFDKAGEMLRKFHKVISEFEPVNTHHFAELYKKKQEIERKTLHVLTEHRYQTKLEASMKKTEEEAEAAARTKMLNRDYKITRKLPRWLQVQSNDHHTLCGARDCYSNCHSPCNCRLKKSFDKSVLRKCSSMNPDGYCKQCGHSYMLHYHNEVMHKKVVEETEMIDEEVRRRFLEADDMEQMKRILLHGYREKILKSIKESNLLTNQLCIMIIEFQNIGIIRSYTKLLENQIAVIEQRLEGEIGDAAKNLRDVKTKLEMELRVVQIAVNSKQ